MLLSQKGCWVNSPFWVRTLGQIPHIALFIAGFLFAFQRLSQDVPKYYLLTIAFFIFMVSGAINLILNYFMQRISDTLPQQRFTLFIHSFSLVMIVTSCIGWILVMLAIFLY